MMENVLYSLKLQGVNGLLGVPETKVTNSIDIDQFVMATTERGQEADNYIRELRDNDRKGLSDTSSARCNQRVTELFLFCVEIE